METRIGGEARLFYGLGSTDLQAVGKRRLEWDPSDWKWDGDLLIASPLAPDPSTYNGRQFFPLGTGTGNATARDSSNSSSSCSDEVNPGIHTGKKESEKRRRLILVDDDNLDDAVATLTLKLGGQDDYRMAESDVGNWDGTSGKKTKLTGATSNRAVCQVDDCGADLSKAKDYHRRHKVCEMHSKASRALVGNVMQRFCQQCSRFHALQEFDDGKRSCRRRLAGHNKRRRKTQPDAVVNSTHSNDNQASAFLLISLLKILSNMHARMNYTDDQDLLSHLLSSLSNHDGVNGDKCISGLLRESQNLLNDKPSNANSDVVSLLPANDPQGPSRPRQQNCLVPSSEIPRKKLHLNDESDEDIIIPSSQKQGVPSPTQDSYPESAQVGDSSVGRSKLNNFDLNDVYIDSDDCVEDADRSPIPVDLGNVSLECPSWVQQESHQSSPPQTSGNSDSGSAQSPSSSSGEAQSRTDRIVFKLFGKEPSNFPFVLRAQILDWLSHSPTDIEGYIRPGCIVLTIYLRMPDFAWEELCYDLTSSLSRLLDISDEETFWRTGWVYIRVQNKIAFIYNGQVVVDTSLPLKNNHYSTVLSVKPIAVSASERAQFTVKGFNISQPSTRILCALEGNYLAQEANDEECLDDQKEHDEFECLNFSCTIPAVTGRGLVEVEDCGLSSSSFLFIVAEKDVCSEIRMLESEIELTSTADLQGGIGKMDARNLAMDFIHEMGWLLHRTQLKSRLGHLEPNADLFSFKRFKWLIEFSMDHEWCAVVKKLLDISFVGMVGSGEHSSFILALLDIDLLHRAVRKNSRSMVELLLKYVPEKVAGGLRLEPKSPIGNDGSFLFRPDAAGPAGLTPLHIAAGRDGSDNILDALTNDPGKMGVEAWKDARDSTGFTPEDYARLRGHFSYIHLVQRKISLRTVSEHVVLNIPSRASSECSVKQKPNEGTASFQIGVARKSCGACNQKLAYGHGRRSLLYRPAMLSMVAIAAVCVCVALLFKSSPEVLYIFRPFRWEMLEFGSI